MRWGVGIGVLVMLILAAFFIVRRFKKPDDGPKDFRSLQELIDFLSGEAVSMARRNYGINLDYSPQSIENVETILGKLHDDYAQSNSDKGVTGLSMAFGAYIGEVIRRNHPGAYWERDHPVAGKNAYPIHWAGGESFPMAWSRKRILNGPEDNVLHKYVLLNEKRAVLQEGMTVASDIEAAKTVLGTASGQPVREYSSCDFGRSRDNHAISCVVPEAASSEVLRNVRDRLGPGLVAFVGTAQWLGEEKHDGVEVVVAPGTTQFDILRVARTDAVNYDMGTEDLVRHLEQLDRKVGIRIDKAESDTIEFEILRLPDNLRPFVEELYKFCPDSVDQGTGTVEEWEREIRKTHRVYLWWD